MQRIGQGFDAHQLVQGRKLIIGGVDIPYEKGLLGHSDADVLVHAIIDALLGASGLGVIGQLFPDNDPTYKGISSIILLQRVSDLLRDYSINNLDATIIAQEPKLQGYFQEMKSNIAKCLSIDDNRVNIKATTTEMMGFTGRKEGIAAMATVLLTKKAISNETL